MAKFQFRRNQSDVERYNRAKRLLESVTFESLRESLQKVIDVYDNETKLIEFFVNHPNLERIEDASAKGGCYYVLNVKMIGRNDKGYYIADTRLRCQLCGENYVESWRNVGKDYHWIPLPHLGSLDYWHNELKPFAMEQLLNQDKLEDMIKQKQLMSKNWF